MHILSLRRSERQITRRVGLQERPSDVYLATSLAESDCRVAWYLLTREMETRRDGISWSSTSETTVNQQSAKPSHSTPPFHMPHCFIGPSITPITALASLLYIVFCAALLFTVDTYPFRVKRIFFQSRLKPQKNYYHYHHHAYRTCHSLQCCLRG